MTVRAGYRMRVDRASRQEREGWEFWGWLCYRRFPRPTRGGYERTSGDIKSFLGIKTTPRSWGMHKTHSSTYSPILVLWYRINNQGYYNTAGFCALQYGSRLAVQYHTWGFVAILARCVGVDLHQYQASCLIIQLSRTRHAVSQGGCYIRNSPLN